MRKIAVYGSFLALTALAVAIVLMLGTAPKKQPGVIGQPGASILPQKQVGVP